MIEKVKIFVNSLLLIMAVPVLFLNILSSIVGGIWLIVRGEWGLVIVGFIYFFITRWIFGFLILLSGLTIVAARYFYNKGNNILGNVFSFISYFYLNILTITTCFLAFIICSSFYANRVGIEYLSYYDLITQLLSSAKDDYIPYLLWSWGMALAEWQYLSSKEPDNYLSKLTTTNITFFYFLFIIGIFIGPTFLLAIIVLLGITHLILLPFIGVVHNNYVYSNFK